MKWGVVVFPGSNCDMDCYWVLRHVLRQRVDYLWHKEQARAEYDCVVLPGGFSYGDYLRTGAIARFSPIMRSIGELARRGNLILGICNGFQILLEAGLLPGAMQRNRSLSFICKYLHMRCENHETPFSRFEASVLKIPIAHGQGNYFIRPDGLEELCQNNQIVFRYCDAAGAVSDGFNPNGSVANIAGIVNRRGNVLGMMPHPERSSERELGSADGRRIFESIIACLS
jgi:phosphoribosylformylglycinamidine synthase I